MNGRTGARFFLLLLLATGCGKKNADNNISYADTPRAFEMKNSIREASGIAASQRNPGYLWVEEDSNNPPQLYLLKNDGTGFTTCYLKNAVNRDWEDIALAAGPDTGKQYIYIGEIGDNDGVHTESSFYRLEEPAAGTDTIGRYDKITFKYEDGPRDAEAFVIDNRTKDIFVISKRDSPSRLYRLSWPYRTDSMNTAKFVTNLSMSGVTSAALSANGTELLIKTYTSLYYTKRSLTEPLVEVFSHPFTQLSYQLEPQGEAVCFARDSSGFYTLSETGAGLQQNLYFYPKR